MKLLQPDKLLLENKMRKRFQGKEYDSSNISGAALAKIGRIVLEDKSSEAREFTDLDSDEIYLNSSKWLDIRIEEICNLGRI